MRKLLPYLYIILATGCAVAKPVVKLNPATNSSNNYWNLGQQYVYYNDDGIWFDCAFNRVEGGTIIFDVKINNESNSAALVSPENFSQIVYSKDSTIISKGFAYNPEVVLTYLKLDKNKAVASSQNAATFSVFSSVLSAGTTVAVAVSKDDKETKDKKITAINATNNLAQGAAWSVVNSSNVRAENNWIKSKSLSELFLRKTTLPQGYYLEGEVHFPYHSRAKWYKVNLYAGNSSASFIFKQEIIKAQYETEYGDY